jgi:hypothetical protein
MGVEPCNKMLWGSTCYFLARLCVGNNCTNSCNSCELLVMRARTGLRATPQPPHSPHARRVTAPSRTPAAPRGQWDPNIIKYNKKKEKVENIVMCKVLIMYM